MAVEHGLDMIDDRAWRPLRAPRAFCVFRRLAYTG
jgi:hypothetical protein